MAFCMKTTLNIDDHLARRAKTAAAERGTTLTQLVEEGLRLVLDPPVDRADYQLQWETVRGRSVPAIDPSDRDSLHDHLAD
jgi:hypothetical protein